MRESLESDGLVIQGGIIVQTPDIFITGLGVYMPDRLTIAQAAEQGLCPAGEVEASGFTGVLVAGDIPAPEMALRGAQEALKRCGQSPDELDLLFYAHTWHQGHNNWLAWSYLKQYLDGGDTFALQLKQGSTGMLAALQLAAGYLCGDPARTSGLLVAADNFGTPLIDRWQPGRFILGDAAAAMVISKEPGFARLLSVRSTDLTEAEQISRGGQPLYPPSIDAKWQTNLAALPPDPADIKLTERANQKMAETFHGAISEAGIEVGDITRMAVVNSTRENVERQFNVLGVDMSKSLWEFGRSVGHCGPADPVLSLDQLATDGSLNPGDHFVMLGMGTGTVIACAVLEIIDRPSWSPETAIP
jgi:3-oxoacyl-[acyl-carrier-protein] synthase III